MTTEDYGKILLLAETFTLATLSCENSQGKCFIISCPLSLHLENNGFQNNIYAGHFKDNPLYAHFWLTLENEVIIDPTIRQFYDDAPQIYIGKKPDDYTSLENPKFEDWIKGVYTTWINPFRFPDYNTHLDLNLLLEINIKAATFIHNEFQDLGLDINRSLKSREYFRGIFEILNNSQTKLGRFSKLKGFDNLLLKAQNNK